MAYDMELAERIRARMADFRSVEAKEEYGGLSFMLNGHMVCGVFENEMIVRVGPEKYHDVEVNVPFARPFAIEGTPMKAWMAIAPEGLRTDEDIDRWIKEGVQAASSLRKKDT